MNPVCLLSGQWWFWPFGPVSGGLWPMLGRVVFIGLIIGGIVLVLRLAFGPGGIWSESTEQDRQEIGTQGQIHGTDDDE